MKRRNIIVISLAVAVFAVIIVCFFAGKTMLFNDNLKLVNYWSVRAYTGDRITVNMHITVDGKPAKVIGDNEQRLTYKDGCTTLKALANSYDNYEFPLKIKTDNISIPLNIEARHWNWWEITESNLYIDIDTETNTYSVSENYKYTAEQPTYHIAHISEPKQTFDGIENINVLIGPKG